MPTPEELAERFVAVVPGAGGAPCVRLEVPAAAPVEFGPYPDPAAARAAAEALALAVAAAVRAAGAG
jgi:hypothetical protein